MQNTALSGTIGPVLDPIFSLRGRFRIAPGGSAVIGFTCRRGVARCGLRDWPTSTTASSAVARAFELAWAHSQVEHGHQDGTEEDAHLYQRLGSHLLFAGRALRGRSHVARRRSAWSRRSCGIVASRATGRSSWPGSPSRQSSPWPGSFWSRTTFFASRALRSTWSAQRGAIGAGRGLERADSRAGAPGRRRRADRPDRRDPPDRARADLGR